MYIVTYKHFNENFYEKPYYDRVMTRYNPEEFGKCFYRDHNITWIKILHWVKVPNRYNFYLQDEDYIRV